MKLLVFTLATMFSFSAYSTTVKIKSSGSIRKDSFKESCAEGVATTRMDLQNKCAEVGGILGNVEFTVQKDVYYVSCIVSATANCETNF